jgi:hypothetical protein
MSKLYVFRSTVGITPRLRTRRSGVRISVGEGIFLFSKTSGSALGPTQILVRLVPVVFFPSLKRSDSEINYLSPSSAEVKNVWRYTATPPVCLHGVDKEELSVCYIHCKFSAFHDETSVIRHN